MLLVGNEVKTVAVNTSDFYFVAGARRINLIVEHEALLLPGDTTRWDGSGSFLNDHFLMIFVHSLNFIEGVRAKVLAPDAFAQTLFSLKH